MYYLILYCDFLKDRWFNFWKQVALHFQIELYNSIIDREGIDGESQAKDAYRAAHEESEDGDVADKHEVSSALIDKVQVFDQGPQWK